MLMGMKADTHVTDLRHILDDPRWRAGASAELKELLRKPLARPSAQILDLNDFVARRTRRQFACGGLLEQQPWD